MDPMVKFLEKILRRTFLVRDKAMTAPLYQLLQIAPVECDLSCQVMSHFHNIWSLEGPVKDLIKFLLNEKGLKQNYWTTHVNKLCSKYHLPSLNEMLKREPPEKQDFKIFVHERIKRLYSEKLRSKIQKLPSLRLIHEDDFDFRNKRLHPIITTAFSRKEVIAMKINVLHLIGEYKCSSNLHRLKIRKTSACEFCEDDNDTTEHVLLRCRPVRESADIQQQLDRLIKWLSVDKSIPKKEIVTFIGSDYEVFSRWITNPCSEGNPGLIRINKDHKSICNLIRLTQLYQLTAHNIRRTASRYRDVPSKHKGVRATKARQSGHQKGRNISSTAKGIQKLSRFISLSKTNNSIRLLRPKHMLQVSPIPMRTGQESPREARRLEKMWGAN